MASRLAAGLPYILVWVSVAYAGDLTPPAQYEGKAVAAVRFDPVAQPIGQAELKELVGVNPGSPLRLTDIRAAIKRLYGTGEYDNIEADAEPATSGLTLIFHTTTQWFVGPVEVQGKNQ